MVGWFKQEIDKLLLSNGKTFQGEAIIAVTEAALQAGAAALLGASIHYPPRGLVTWKSIVGTDVASDALSNLSPAGVVGGALLVVGDDYGESAGFDYGKMVLPPSTYQQEASKFSERLPAAQGFITEHNLSERFGADGPNGIILQGGHHGVVLRA